MIWDCFRTVSYTHLDVYKRQGWGMTTDGKSLIVSDGTKNIYFLNPENPSQLKRYISVAGNTDVYDSINELEYYNNSIYACLLYTSRCV